MADERTRDDERITEIIGTHQRTEGPALKMLQAVQADIGYVPREAVSMIADVLNVSRADIHGVLSFYHDLHQKRPGRHVLKLCRAEACQSVGAAESVTSRAVCGAAC